MPRERDQTGFDFWSKVAVEIARRTERAQDGRSVRGEPFWEAAHRRLKSEVSRYIVEIGRGMAHLARGQHAAIELHNIGAAVWNAASLVPPHPRIEIAGAGVLSAAERLFESRAEAVVLVADGRYPPLLEEAGTALEKYRETLQSRVPRA